MKILVFGAREWVNDATIRRILSKLPKDTTLIHGGARGADRIAGTIGKQLGLEVREYPVTNSDWERHGKAADVLRNAKMLSSEHPDGDGVLIDKAFGFSTGPHNRGTHDMAEKLWKAQIRFEVLFS